MKNIKNIIFDLGGVILNIDMKKTEQALEKLGVGNFFDHSPGSEVTSLFKDYETGKIDDDTFIQSIQSLVGNNATKEDIVNAWNALLLDFPPERISLLQGLRKRYRLFLLSNTNGIHYKQFQRQFLLQTGYALDELFEKTYYSHTINLRKPDVACFKFVVDENQLNTAETLFIDDSEVNLAGAKAAGLAIAHINAEKTILNIDW